MLLDKIKLNSKLPFDEDYKEEVAEVDFYELSYESTGTEYTLGSCPDGKIIHKMECEEALDYNNRRKQTPTRSYVSSIINKYNSSVFRNEAVRGGTNATYEQLMKDADGYGNSLGSLMRKALLKAQIDGCSYLLADSTASDTEILTIAQKTSLGVRPYIRFVEKKSVVAYEEIEEKIMSAIVMFEDDLGNEFARYMDREVFVDITLGKQYQVTAISEPYAHGYSDIPLVEIEPFDDSQAKPISYSQRTIVNILSLLMQEVSDHTFTKHILSGVRNPQDDSGNTNKITYGSKRMIVLEDSGAKLDTIGSDVSQAESLRKQIEVEEANLYYSAGFGKSNAQDVTNLSGIALLISREDFFINCNQLKMTIEQAENKIMELISGKEGIEYVPAVYSDKYIADDNGEHLLRLRDLLALPLPATFKKLAIRNYINTFFNVGENDMSIIEQELNSQEQV